MLYQTSYCAPARTRIFITHCAIHCCHSVPLCTIVLNCNTPSAIHPPWYFALIGRLCRVYLILDNSSFQQFAGAKVHCIFSKWNIHIQYSDRVWQKSVFDLFSFSPEGIAPPFPDFQWVFIKPTAWSRLFHQVNQTDVEGRARKLLNIIRSNGKYNHFKSKSFQLP